MDEFDHVIAGLKDAGFTQNPGFKDALADARRDWDVAFAKLLKENGLTKQEFISELVVGVIVTVMLRRAVKQGNTPKTIRWAAASLATSIKFYGRRQEVLLKNLR